MHVEFIPVFVHPWLSFHGSFRCLGQEDPCEGISLGACFVEPGSILKTYTATPDRCSHLKILWKLFWNDIENLHKTYWKPFHQVFQALWDEQQLWVLESPVGWNTVSPAFKRLSTRECTNHITPKIFLRTVNHLPGRSLWRTALRVQTPAMLILRMIVSTLERE